MENQIKPVLSKKQMRIHVMSLWLSQEKEKMLSYLTWVHRHMCPKREWFSTYNPYDGGSILMRNDAMCKTFGIDNIRISMFDGRFEPSRMFDIFRFKEESSLTGSFGSSRVQVF